MKNRIAFFGVFLTLQLGHAAVNFYDCAADGDSRTLYKGTGSNLVMVINNEQVLLNDKSRVWNYLQVDNHDEYFTTYKSVPPSNFLQSASLVATLTNEALKGAKSVQMILENTENKLKLNFDCARIFFVLIKSSSQ
jgi:hypothetical protein